MSHKRLGVMVILAILLTFPVSASMVSLLVVETGVNESISTGQFSSLWEGGLMSALFDAGHIVTNSPIARMERRPSQDLNNPVIEEDFNEAIEGGAEFFILGYLEYNTQSGRAVPVGMVLKIFNSNSRQLVYEQNFPAGTGVSLNDEYQNAQNAGRAIVSRIRTGRV